MSAQGYDKGDGDDPFEGPSETVISVAGKQIALSLKDAHAMRLALLEYLKNSKIAERDYLLQMLRDVPGWIDEDGVLRISAWYLQAPYGALVLTNRLPHGPTGGGIYNAYVERTSEGWKVTRLEFERVKYRP